MQKNFKESVVEALKCYVYALVDPRDNRIFYVGKGTGNRVYQHAEAAINDDADNMKLAMIREIQALGLEVKYYILRHNLTDQEAFLVESTIIDLLTYKQFNTETLLTNLVSGHHQWNEGIKTDAEINMMYDCKKIEPMEGDRLLLVSLNRSYDQAKATGVYQRDDDYESTRKYWFISPRKAEKIDYVLGIYRGIVRVIIKVKGYKTSMYSERGILFKKPRYEFEGDVIYDSPYLNTDVSDYPFGSGGAITYIPRHF